MATIVIHAPWSKKDKFGIPTGRTNQSHSWETYCATGTGLGYMLYPNEVALLQKGPSTVILLRNDRQQKRAEGSFLGLTGPREAAGSGGWRYDVHFEVEQVPYKYVLPKEQLKRNGVKVF